MPQPVTFLNSQSIEITTSDPTTIEKYRSRPRLFTEATAGAGYAEPIMVAGHTQGGTYDDLTKPELRAEIDLRNSTRTEDLIEVTSDATKADLIAALVADDDDPRA
ncbi:hypothetical protein [Nocardioides bruguierae]|uniref:Uncharacterized protein n=1 Tax=Nocardioides bruguierae TaxID=2945102 RepID=A0A9X2DAV3_9ACTN|nr:hypothetical protein [Nocardioides bruguierae]MCM0622512.1 hypothetical protein [Nocardioides bruguierae]